MANVPQLNNTAVKMRSSDIGFPRRGPNQLAPAVTQIPGGSSADQRWLALEKEHSKLKLQFRDSKLR